MISDFHTIVTGGFMVGFTVLLLAFGLILFRRKPFDPVKALNLKPGVYQNKKTGSIIEVKQFSGNVALVATKTNVYNLHHHVLVKDYEFLGSV